MTLHFYGICAAGALTVAVASSSFSEAQEAIMIVTHEVEDFGRWKEVFDGAIATRRSVGEMSAYILHNPVNQRVVTVVFEWDTMERARAFAEDPALANGMAAAGVVSEPNFTFIQAERSY